MEVLKMKCPEQANTSTDRFGMKEIISDIQGAFYESFYLFNVILIYLCDDIKHHISEIT